MEQFAGFSMMKVNGFWGASVVKASSLFCTEECWRLSFFLFDY